MQRYIGVDVIVRLADRITQPMRDIEDRVSRATRRMADGLKLSATLNTSQITAAANRLSASGARAQQFGRDQLQLSRG